MNETIFFLRFCGGVALELACIVLGERVERAQQEATRLGYHLDQFRRIGNALLTGITDGAEAAAAPCAPAVAAPEATAPFAPEAADAPFAPEAAAKAHDGPLDVGALLRELATDLEEGRVAELRALADADERRAAALRDLAADFDEAPGKVTREEEIGNAAEAGDWPHFAGLLTDDEARAVCTHVAERWATK